jgi:hypothetical protein
MTLRRQQASCGMSGVLGSSWLQWCPESFGVRLEMAIPYNCRRCFRDRSGLLELVFHLMPAIVRFDSYKGFQLACWFL